MDNSNNIVIREEFERKLQDLCSYGSNTAAYNKNQVQKAINMLKSKSVGTEKPKNCYDKLIYIFLNFFIKHNFF